MAGLVGAFFLGRSFLSKNIGQISEEAAGGRCVGNLHLAKSLIEQKWDGYVGFFWVTTSFALQIFFTIWPMVVSISSRSFLIIAGSAVIFVILSQCSIFWLCRKDGIKFILLKLINADKQSIAPASLNGRELLEYMIGGSGDKEYYQEIANLLCARKHFNNIEEALDCINKILAQDKHAKQKLKRIKGPFD